MGRRSYRSVSFIFKSVIMKIAIIISSLSFGGAEKQAVLDANLLSKKHEVFLYFFKDGPLKATLAKEVRSELIGKGGYVETARQLRKKIRANKIEVVHASLFAPIVLSSLASIFTSTKVFWHFHSHEYDIPLKSKLAFQWLAKLPNVWKILFVNHELLNYFSSYKFPQSKTGVQYNHSEISVPPAKPAKKKQQALHFGYVGRVIPLKRIHYLIELAEYLLSKQFSDFKVHIVGDGAELKGIKELAEEKGLTDWVECHGFQTDVIKYYREFDIFVNPSREECLSIAMIDAGMMALPIVAFDVGGNNEIVVDGKTGFIVDSKEAFFQKNLLLAEDSAIRDQFGSASQQHCRNLFSKEKHADEFQNMYKEIINVA